MLLLSETGQENLNATYLSAPYFNCTLLIPKQGYSSHCFSTITGLCCSFNTAWFFVSAAALHIHAMHIHNNSNLPTDRQIKLFEEGCVAATHLFIATNSFLLENKMPR